MREWSLRFLGDTDSGVGLINPTCACHLDTCVWHSSALKNESSKKWEHQTLLWLWIHAINLCDVSPETKVAVWEGTVENVLYATILLWSCFQPLFHHSHHVFHLPLTWRLVALAVRVDGYDISCGVTKKLSENARLKRLAKLVLTIMIIIKWELEFDIVDRRGSLG